MKKISEETLKAVLGVMDSARESGIICLKYKGFTTKEIANLKTNEIDFKNSEILNKKVDEFTLKNIECVIRQTVILLNDKAYLLPKSEYVFRNLLGKKLTQKGINYFLKQFDEKLNNNFTIKKMR